MLKNAEDALRLQKFPVVTARYVFYSKHWLVTLLCNSQHRGDCPSYGWGQHRQYGSVPPAVLIELIG